MPVNGVAVGAVGVGGLLLYAGIRGFSVLKAAQNITQGNAASKGQAVSLLAIPGGSDSPPSLSPGASNSELVNAAMKYNGVHNYSYGGRPADGVMDCSSYMNQVIGNDLVMAIPGFSAGTYHGQSHGPPTGAWLLWGGVETIQPGNVQAGDLIVGATHMGMITSPLQPDQEYISDHDPAEGISIKPTSTFPDVVKVYKRLKAA